MYKLVTFAGYDPQTGPHIFPIEPDVNRTIGHIKMARPLPPEIEQYIRSATPIPGKTQLLIDAMGAGEFYGSNVNGDYFPESALSHKGADYGYETFMHFAYPFKHHVNKDPARAYGDKVTLSAYDPHMHRVLLIVRIDDSKCQDILSDLAQNRYWDVSMGCRVPWDECSICKNRARNRGEYCAHLRYQMNKILQDGRRVCAYNWLPKFFDISFVTIGAEKASHVLRKVAMQEVSFTPHGMEIGGYIKTAGSMSSAKLGAAYYAKLADAEKDAVQKKRAKMDKDVPSQPAADIQGVTPDDKAKLNSFMADAGEIKAQEMPLPPEVLNALGRDFPLRQVFATLGALGIDLRPQEFQRVVLVKQGATKLADVLEQRRLVFDETKSGSIPKWAQACEHLTENDVSEKVAMLLRPYMKERSCYPEILFERLQRMEKQAVRYGRDTEWYPMTDEEKRRSSGISGLLPAGMALAAGFMVFRRAFPGLITKGPAPIRALAKNPWLLPILLGAGVGATVGLQTMEEPRPITPYGTGSGLDGKNRSAYHEAKTAGINPIARIGLIPLAYIYSGIQQKRWQRGARLNAFDRFMAMRPDVAGLASFALAPRIMYGMKNLTKHGGVGSDLAMYAIGSPTKLMPAVLAGAALDISIFNAIKRLMSRKKGTPNG